METYEEYLERACDSKCEFCQAVKNKTRDWSPYTADNTTFCKMHSEMYQCAKMGKVVTALMSSKGYPSKDIGNKMSCSWCGGLDEHRDEYDESCNECEFCHSNICCNCWDGDEVCYSPGEGYCPKCKKAIFECQSCLDYIKSFMEKSLLPICKHLDENSPDYIGTT